MYEAFVEMGSGITVPAFVDVPERPRGLILFAHGSGSGRHSPRNQYVARVLRAGGFATLLLDLLTRKEEDIDNTTAALRFDIGLLAQRLVAATRWARATKGLARLSFGYFGASTGAAAALVAAAELSDEIAAVVSRGGRPDLAGAHLGDVRAPTLLIVGGDDLSVVALNREAADRMRATVELAIISGATHLFQEPGALPEVARLACAWFSRHLSKATSPSSRHPRRGLGDLGRAQ